MSERDFNWRVWLANLLVLFCVVVLSCSVFGAVSITLTDLCSGFTLSKRGNDVLLRCPGNPNPVFTFKDCRNPVVTRSPGSVRISCA